jgi:hypothetical protein
MGSSDCRLNSSSAAFEEIRHGTPGQVGSKAMKKQAVCRLCLDLAMVAVLVALMAHGAVSEGAHEFFGTAAFMLFIIHNILNAPWYRAESRTLYHPTSISTISDEKTSIS